MFKLFSCPCLHPVSDIPVCQRATLSNGRCSQLARETTYLNQTYTLPDGQAICLGLERSQAAEVLFDPSLMGIEGPGIAQAAFEAIQVCCRLCRVQQLCGGAGDEVQQPT